MERRRTGVQFPIWTRHFLISIASRPALGLMETLIEYVREALSLRKKGPRREADHSPPMMLRLMR
jgi:hypothetical protein